MNKLRIFSNIKFCIILIISAEYQKSTQKISTRRFLSVILGYSNRLILVFSFLPYKPKISKKSKNTDKRTITSRSGIFFPPKVTL
jgi:hypothetical protein